MLGLVRQRWVLPRILRQWGVVLSVWIPVGGGVMRLWVAWVRVDSLLRDGSDGSSYRVSYDVGANDGVSDDCCAYECFAYYSFAYDCCAYDCCAYDCCAYDCFAYDCCPYDGIAYYSCAYDCRSE